MVETYIESMETVSLDKYRTPGVRVFTGRERGIVVAEAIKEEYGEDVAISVPDDVFCVANGFIRGFATVLPHVQIPAGEAR